MDYEKKYNDAMKKILSYETDEFDRVNVRPQDIFPELRESEDERIINSIIAVLENDKKHYLKEIAWLEKQKEQIPYIDFVIKPHKGDDNNPYDMRVSEAQEYAIKRGFGIPFNDGEVYVDERHLTQTIGNILRWADEHPKEQKPAWSEEDERIIKILLEFIHCWGDDFFSEKEERRDCVDWLEKNLEYLKPAKSAEWSEEDEKMIWDIVDVLEADNVENKRKFPYALSLHERYKKMVDWLKSLRPSWKPSEEQMDALHTLLSVVPRDPALYELYEQLDKMRK